MPLLLLLTEEGNNLGPNTTAEEHLIPLHQARLGPKAAEVSGTSLQVNKTRCETTGREMWTYLRRREIFKIIHFFAKQPTSSSIEE